MKMIREIIFDNRAGSEEDYKETCEAVEKAIEEASSFFDLGKGYQVSVSFVSEDEIHSLNREFRDTDRATDVLSFPMEETDPRGVNILGDIVLCRDVALRQAEEFGHSALREITYLTVHSFLHLMGYDHMEDDDKVEMRTMEKEIMKKMGIFKNEYSAVEAGEDEVLIRKAVEMLDMAYAPYSRYHVGAALLTASGKIYTGCNIENASYGATICAERTAAVKAVSEGDRHFVRIAIACSGDTFAWPCGICRQFLNEFAEDGFEVIVIDNSGRTDRMLLTELLPNGFRGKDMGISIDD